MEESPEIQVMLAMLATPQQKANKANKRNRMMMLSMQNLKTSAKNKPYQPSRFNYREGYFFP